MVERRLGKENAYQVILLDWKMPGMDGLETARALRQRAGEDLPILIISAYDWSDIETEAREVGRPALYLNRCSSLIFIWS